MSHGGKRKGAGRKPALKRTAITVKLSPVIAAKLRAYCEINGISQAVAVTAWVCGNERENAKLREAATNVASIVVL